MNQFLILQLFTFLSGCDLITKTRSCFPSFFYIFNALCKRMNMKCVIKYTRLVILYSTLVILS